MTPSELELAENLANEHGEFEAADRRLMRKLLEERAGLVERLGQAEEALRDLLDLACVANDGDPFYAEAEGLDAEAILDRGRAALVSSSIPKETPDG